MSDILVRQDVEGVRRYEDQNDGTWAEVIYGGASGSIANTDIVIDRSIGEGVITRFRDMGDGTWAEVIYLS